jgi:hypothetical protein
MDHERWRRVEELYNAARSLPARLARLDREARLLAALNHPNIATIHGVEDADGIRALGSDVGPRGTTRVETNRARDRGRTHFSGWTLAYVSDESGAFDVHVSPLDGSSTHRVSSAGGIHPRWRDANELLYLGAARFEVARDGSTFSGCAPEAAARKEPSW